MGIHGCGCVRRKQRLEIHFTVTVHIMNSTAFKILGVLLVAGAASAIGQSNEVPVVPLPVKARLVDSAAFQLTSAKVIVGSSEITNQAAEILHRITGGKLKTKDPDRARGGIAFRIDRDLFPELPDWQRAEGYRLSVKASRVELVASTEHGLFNGLQTLVQLVSQSPRGKWQIPACEIEDYPRFQWRALLVDPARHFLPPEFLKKFVDAMAFYKFNRLQLHLTDDVGWRIEIKKYPRLTQIGSVRKESPRHGDRNQGDGQVYGPFFYTQEQIRDLVAYAKARYVTLMPEFEIPGHSGAAMAAHPELSCTGGPFEVLTRFKQQYDIFCAGNDDAVSFMKGVLAEMCELFPSEFIHIGGDEAPRDRWKTCPKCQARMKAEGLKHEAQLQTWINRRLEDFLASKGRRMIGWDEILEGGLTPGAVVMSWRGNESGIAAAQAGHDVVMSPTTHCYFDYAQAKGTNEPECIGGFVPLEKVYAFEPVPAVLSPDQRRHILGAQGNLWGEFMWDGKDVEYFAFPRALALAEVVWSPADRRNYQDFLTRLKAQFRQLDRMQVNHRQLDAETAQTSSEPKTNRK